MDARIQRLLKSWTAWLAVVWVVLSISPQLFEAVIEYIGVAGEDEDALIARLVAISLLLTRIRTIIEPFVKGGGQ